MPAPEGNKNAEGNKGGGRKSAYQEQADAENLFKMFFGDESKEEVLAKIKTGKYSLKDLFMSKAYSGSEKALIAMFNRVFPANINIGGQKDNPLRILNESDLDKRIAELKDTVGETVDGEVTKESS